MLHSKGHTVGNLGRPAARLAWGTGPLSATPNKPSLRNSGGFSLIPTHSMNMQTHKPGIWQSHLQEKGQESHHQWISLGLAVVSEVVVMILTWLKPSRLLTQISSLLTLLSRDLPKDTHEPRKGQQSQAWEFVSNKCILLIAAGGQQRVTTRGLDLGNRGVFQFAKKETPLALRELATWEPQLQAWAPVKMDQKSIQNLDLKVDTLFLGKFGNQEWVKNWGRTDWKGNQAASVKVENQKDILKCQVPRVAAKMEQEPNERIAVRGAKWVEEAKIQLGRMDSVRQPYPGRRLL